VYFIIGLGGPRRLLILRGNPPPKAAGPFASLLGYAVHDRTLLGGPKLLVVVIIGLTLYFFFRRGE